MPISGPFCVLSFFGNRTGRAINVRVDYRADNAQDALDLQNKLKSSSGL